MSGEYVATTIYGVKYPNHLQEKAEKIYRNTDLEIAHGIGSGDNVIGIVMSSSDYGKPVNESDYNTITEIHDEFIDKSTPQSENLIEIVESDGVKDETSIYTVLERI